MHLFTHRWVPIALDLAKHPSTCSYRQSASGVNRSWMWKSKGIYVRHICMSPRRLLVHTQCGWVLIKTSVSEEKRTPFQLVRDEMHFVYLFCHLCFLLYTKCALIVPERLTIFVSDHLSWRVSNFLHRPRF